MTTRGFEASPVLFARITGFLILVMAVGAGFAEGGVRTALIVPGNATATAANILASEQLFRSGFFGYLVAFLCDVPVSILLYLLLKPVSNPLALIAASFRLVYTAVAGASLLNYSGTALLLGGSGYLQVLGSARLNALALYSLDMYKHGFSLALIFFGLHLLLLGLLIFRSVYFPKALGILIAFAGFAYLIDSISFLLLPNFNTAVVPFLAVPECAELVLALWLLAKGVRDADASQGAGRAALTPAG